MAQTTPLENDHAIPWFPGQVANRRRFIPNVPVLTHDGDRHMFYDDLVKDRTVLIHFFSLAQHANYPVSRNLTHIQKLLGDSFGKSVFLYSITTDPEHDDVPRLAEFAERHQANHGWKFITGEPNAIEIVKRIFFFHEGEHADHSNHNGVGPPPDCSLGLLRYGNDTAGLWGSVPAKSPPQQIADRIQWVQPRASVPAKSLKRGGPHPLTTKT